MDAISLLMHREHSSKVAGWGQRSQVSSINTFKGNESWVFVSVKKTFQFSIQFLQLPSGFFRCMVLIFRETDHSNSDFHFRAEYEIK